MKAAEYSYYRETDDPASYEACNHGPRVAHAGEHLAFARVSLVVSLDPPREAGELGAEDIAMALHGEGKDPAAAARRGKGLISFAHRLGQYEGVMV